MPYLLSHYYCLPARAKPGIAALCEVEVFHSFERGGNILPTCNTQAAQRFPYLLQTFYEQRGCFPRTGMICSVGYTERTSKRVRKKKKQN